MPNSGSIWSAISTRASPGDDLAVRTGRSPLKPDADGKREVEVRQFPDWLAHANSGFTETFPVYPRDWLHKAKTGVTVETAGIEPTSAIA